MMHEIFVRTVKAIRKQPCVAVPVVGKRPVPTARRAAPRRALLRVARRALALRHPLLARRHPARRALRRVDPVTSSGTSANPAKSRFTAESGNPVFAGLKFN